MASTSAQVVFGQIVKETFVWSSEASASVRVSKDVLYSNVPYSKFDDLYYQARGRNKGTSGKSKNEFYWRNYNNQETRFRFIKASK